ncbi:hypothetical protein [Nitratireductor alexandrii]|uniref:hypothetical protein n=1 Tax=Nitratireductor alexandrii TaxID=2448161 RepID=UPI0013DFAB4A|nr:hypothetical protein [Nitratireductor alexandrii]
MFEAYFGLIEVALVFGLAVAFYLWQRHDLKKARDKTRARERQRQADKKTD